MRAICGLFALLIMLGPIGMGTMLNVDSPIIGEDALSTNYSDALPEDHGTRSTPSQGAMFVDLFLRNSGVMNTSATSGTGTTTTPGSGATFTLQKELESDYKIENPSPGFPMAAFVTLAGGGDLTVTVRDNAGGNVVGSATHDGFNYGITPTDVKIDLALTSGANYTFISGHFIEIEFSFTQTGSLIYNNGNSRLQLYGTTVIDITVDTANFFDWGTNRFYPNDINFPDERKKVKMRGIVSEVFGKEGAWQYVDSVDVNILGPGFNETRTASYDRSDNSYSYTWSYPFSQTWGKYTLTTIVIDEQANEFTVQGSFNMSQYGVLLTSPSQLPEEGSFQAQARMNLVQGGLTIYDVNVRNTGYTESGYNITTTGQAGWDWWIEGDNLTTNNNKTGSIASIMPNDHMGIRLVIDSESQDLGNNALVLISATSSEDSSEIHTLTTVSTVVLRYNVELDFTETSQSSLKKKLETGDTVNIGLTVTNNGGENDNINFIISLVPAGWTVLLEGQDLQGSQGSYNVDLVSGDSTALTLTISTPPDKGEEEVAIDITARSQGSEDQGDNPVASDKLSVEVETSTGLKLTLSDQIEKDVDPDQDAVFRFKLENTGTKFANYTVTFSGFPSSDGWEIGDASFDPSGYTPTKDFNNLAPSNPQDFWLYIEPTIEVLSKNYTIQIHVENNQAPSSKFANQLVFLTVNEFYNVEIVEPLSLELSEKADPGDDVQYEIIIENNGNVEERVTVSVDLPGGWELDFGNASTDWIEDLSPGEVETIPVVLTVPDDAQGDETVEITISIIPAKSDVIQVVTSTEIGSIWYQPLMTLIVPLLLFIVILVMVVVIYKRR
jgi:uncharacterized membrane protein